MPSPYPVASLLGSLLFLVRHEPLATEDHAAVLALLRGVRDGHTLTLEAEGEGLRINGQIVALDAPGAALVCEQMLLHGVRIMELPPELADGDLRHLIVVLAAFPGTYASFTDVLDALGVTATRIGLTRLTSEFEVFQPMPWRPRSRQDAPDGVESAALELPDIRRDHTDEIERVEDISFDTPSDDPESVPFPTGGTDPVPRPALDQLVQRGREAIGRDDGNGLLDVALEILQAENEAPSEMASSSYRIELRRLMARKQLVLIAEFVHSDRKQESISVLRRFGAEATEILMALLAEATTINQRRAYYSAISQISHGTDAVVYHLAHPQWFVVRNAADLCGEMRLIDAVPDLVRQCHHGDERVRKAVAEALGRIGTPAAMEGLRKMLSDPASVVRVKALAHLSGRPARGMTGALGKLLEREELEVVQQEALLALGRIASPESVALLGEWAAPGGKLMGRRPLALRLAAVRGLVLAGPAALNVLTTLQREDSPEVQEAASKAIDALKP